MYSRDEMNYKRIRRIKVILILFQPPGYMIQRWTMTNTRNWVNSVDLLTTISSKDRRLIDGHPISNQNDTVTN